MHSPLDNYKRILEYCNRYLKILKTIPGFEQTLNQFQLKLAEAVANSILGCIASPDTETARLNLRRALCALAAGVANTMLFSGKLNKSILFRKPDNFNAETLFQAEDKVLTGRCVLLYQTAQEYLSLLAGSGLSVSAISTLKLLTDIYETANEPPSKAIVSLAMQYAHKVTLILADAANILTAQLDAFAIEASINEKAFATGYFRLRALG